mmetsp:Transcript_469/g.563  ORF Transcript_469/g.563 Transcript_469/m.563 type:complete len:398 (-) Transcript_469:2135-3328(-)
MISNGFHDPTMNLQQRRSRRRVLSNVKTSAAKSKGKVLEPKHSRKRRRNADSSLLLQKSNGKSDAKSLVNLENDKPECNDTAKELKGSFESVKKKTKTEHIRECGICFDEIKVRGKLSCCEHEFCYCCMAKWLKRSSTCPHCKREVKVLSKTSPQGKTSETSFKVKKRVLRDTIEAEELNNGNFFLVFPHQQQYARLNSTVRLPPMGYRRYTEHQRQARMAERNRQARNASIERQRSVSIAEHRRRASFPMHNFHPSSVLMVPPSMEVVIPNQMVRQAPEWLIAPPMLQDPVRMRVMSGTELSCSRCGGVLYGVSAQSGYCQSCHLAEELQNSFHVPTAPTNMPIRSALSPTPAVVTRRVVHPDCLPITPNMVGALPNPFGRERLYNHVNALNIPFY